MTSEITAEPRTEKLGRGIAQDNIVILKYSSDLLAELNGLAEGKQLFDAVLIDVTQCGFLFTAELLITAAQLAKNLLELQGALVFLKTDKAVAIVRDSLMGFLSFHTFDSYAELFDHSPSLAKHIQQALGSSNGLIEESTDLKQQVLMSAIPVLTALGIKLKAGMDSARKRNMVLAAIDNYTPLSAIANRLEAQGRLSLNELIEEVKALEQSKAVYPLFPKVPFLVNCFRNQTQFNFKDYVIAARLLTQEQVDDLLFEIQNMPVRDRLTIGPLAVKKGLISTRQLEVSLQDQAFYGQSGDSEDHKLVKNKGEDSQVQSLVGHLGTTDPSNLLQNICQNRETGVLSVEYRDMQFRALFDIGKLTHAKVGKVLGNTAVVEFASAWKEGIFVFIQRTPPADLNKDACKLSKPLEKLLLDAALAKDNMEVVFKKLPKGLNSVLEKLEDEKKLLGSDQLFDPAEKKPTPLTSSEKQHMQRLWDSLDGLVSLHELIRMHGDMATFEVARAADMLLHYQLASMPNLDLAGPLGKFQQLCRRVTDTIGPDRSMAFLRLSLRDTMGYSGRARIFVLGSRAEVGVDMVAARGAGASLSQVINDIENWQVKYIEYVSQELDSEILLGFIREIHQTE